MQFKKMNRKVFLGFTLKKYGKKIIMPWRLLIVMIVFLSLILFLNQMANENALARPFAPTGKIVFSKGKFESIIYVVDDDGSNLTQLTNTKKDIYPTWSLDGKQIAFSSGRNIAGTNLSGQIYVMNADGTEQRQLTNGPYDSSPDWSPDRKTMAFGRSDWLGVEGGWKHDIYLMNSDGGDQRRLVAGGSHGPVFSPDGKKIAFVTAETLAVINVDGTGLAKLVPEPIQGQGSASWSPNGRWIAFTGWGGRNQQEIYRINADGSELINLTNHGAIDYGPTWSPDSTKIAFASIDRVGDHGIYLMNADGTEVRKLISMDGITKLNWYGLRDSSVSVTPHQKKLTNWGWLKQNSK